MDTSALCSRLAFVRLLRKMQHMRLLNVLLLSRVLMEMPCYAAEREQDVVKQLQWVEKADPVADAKKAVDRSEFTFLGVDGFTWTIPGIDESKKFELRKKY